MLERERVDACSEFISLHIVRCQVARVQVACRGELECYRLVEEVLGSQKGTEACKPCEERAWLYPSILECCFYC
jgi:hypothetical protein